MTPRNWLTIGLASLACIEGGVAVVAALSPWFRFSFLGVAVDIKGTSHALDGRYALALGIAAIVVSVLAVWLGPRHVAALPAGVVLAVIGVAGLVVLRHQDRHLTTAKSLLQADGFATINTLFAAHTTPTWGFWLEVGAFISLTVTALAMTFTAGGQSARSEQPQGPTVDRDDAASQV